MLKNVLLVVLVLGVVGCSKEQGPAEKPPVNVMKPPPGNLEGPPTDMKPPVPN